MLKSFKALALAGAMLSCASVAAAQTPGAFVDVPGGKLWYETCGSGPRTMVLLHDGGLHSVAWDEVWPGLCKTFHVVRYDRRGFGRSPEARAPYSPVADVQAIMAAASFKHAIVVGCSDGGGIAVDFALAHPGEVDRLVLIGPNVSGVPRSKYYFDRIADLQAKYVRGDVAGAIRSSWLYPPDDEKDKARAVELQLASPQDLTHKDPVLPGPPAAPRLGAIKAPTLVLVGEFDQADNQAQAGIVAYAIPGARREIVPNAGHLIYLAQPAVFTDIVTRFAADQPSPGTEEALRRIIGEFERGQPDYSRMGPQLAAGVRSQIEVIKRLQTANGALKSITFKGVDTNGDDRFEVAYEHTTGDVLIAVDNSGRVIDLRPTR